MAAGRAEFRTLMLADAIYVAEHMRARDRECLQACTTIQTAESFALNRWQTEGPAWTLWDGAEPVCMGGISMGLPWLGVCWMIATDRMTPTTWKKAVRHVHTVLGNASKAIPRIEAQVLGTWPQAMQFAQRLGFEHEGTRHGAGREGQDVLIFVYRGK